MKKFFLVILIAFLSYIVGYKTKNYVQLKIYFPLKKYFSKSINVQNYSQLNCPSKSIQIGYFGQSNSTNTVSNLSNLSIPNNLYQFDWRTGKCFKYREPLIAVDGIGGNVITHTAIKISQEIEKDLVVIPFGINSSSILDWAYGDLRHHHHLALKNIKENNFTPSIFLWHQGENDARMDGLHPSQLLKEKKYERTIHLKRKNTLGIDKQTYKDGLEIVIKRNRKYFPNANFGIALVSRCNNKESWTPVIEAQKEIIRSYNYTFMSADSDSIDLRYDGCHFSKKGAKILGEKYFDSLKKLLY